MPVSFGHFYESGMDHMLITAKRASSTKPDIPRNTTNTSSWGFCGIMLNSKKLTELLTENVHPKLFPKWM